MSNAEGAMYALLAILIGAVAYGLAPYPRRRRTNISRSRYEAGRCTRCEYDVRASPARCPECGDDLFAQVVAYYRSVLD